MRAKTAKEMRAEFLEHILCMVSYWAEVPGKTKAEALGGLAFSLLVALDGGCDELPAYDLIPCPHPDDEEFAKSEGDNWVPQDVVINNCQLHDEFVAMEKAKTAQPPISPALKPDRNAITQILPRIKALPKSPPL